MSPVAKFEDQPAVSLILPAPSFAPAADSNETSRAAMMQIIFGLLLLIGDNMAKIQQLNGQTQLNTAKIAQDQADGALKNEQNLLKQLKHLHKEQRRAAKWHIADQVLKGTGAAIALCIGGLLCETPIGFGIIAMTIAFTASPLFNKTVNLIAKGFEAAGFPKSWADIMAQISLLVVITAASFGTEAASVGWQGGITAVEDTAETGAQAAPESETSAQAPTQVYRTSATTLASLQALMSSSLVPESISKIPGIKKYPWLMAVLTILTEIAVSVAAMQTTPASGAVSYLARLSPSTTTLRIAMASFATVSSIGTDTATGYRGYNELQQGKTNEKIAPIQSLSQFEDGFFQIMTQLTTLLQKTYEKTMDVNQTIFKTDFSSDMQACVAVQG